jgi:hypothetical protein
VASLLPFSLNVFDGRGIRQFSATIKRLSAQQCDAIQVIRVSLIDMCVSISVPNYPFMQSNLVATLEKLRGLQRIEILYDKAHDLWTMDKMLKARERAHGRLQGILAGRSIEIVCRKETL